MRAVGTHPGAGTPQPPLPLRSRAGVSAALLVFLTIFATPLLAPPSASAQGPGGWSFQDDAFADLWFHGLAVVGFHGDGTAPLYDPGYADALRRDRAGAAATPLHAQRAALLDAFRTDPAFEVFHFVPLYFAGAGREGSMQALRAVADAPRGAPPAEAAARLGVQVVAGLLPSAAQRRTLGMFLDALATEWTEVVEPRRRARAWVVAERLEALSSNWAGPWAGSLKGFLSAEGANSGTVFVVPALGREGRFLERSPVGGGPLVAVGMDSGSGDGAPARLLASLLRELCYPAVRRALAPFESRLPDRIGASRASDLAATRCGELLLERHAPALVADYRARFGLPTGGMGPGFLSTSGAVPGAAAWEGQMETALLRELKLEMDGARTPVPPVRRN